MRRNNFVTNKIPKRIFVSLDKILKPGTVWTTKAKHENNIYIRIKKLVSADSDGKCTFKVETTQQPKWWSVRHPWAQSDWLIDESFVRYEFHKKYKRVYFVEPFNMPTGFESHNLGRSWYFAMTIFCVMALILDIITKSYKTGIFALGFLALNLYNLREQIKKNE